MNLQCLYCKRTYSSAYGLKRHLSEKHQYIEEKEINKEIIPTIQDLSNLWDINFTLGDFNDDFNDDNFEVNNDSSEDDENEDVMVRR
jgi:hypothetical protein